MEVVQKLIGEENDNIVFNKNLDFMSYCSVLSPQQSCSPRQSGKNTFCKSNRRNMRQLAAHFIHDIRTYAETVEKELIL